MYQHPLNLFLETANKFPNKLALRSLETNGVSFTYAELKNAVENVALHLYGLGIKTGDRVALCGENNPLWGAAFLGILRAGGTVVPFDLNLPESEVQFILQDSGAKYWILSETATQKQSANKQHFQGNILTTQFAVSPLTSVKQVEFLSIAPLASILYTSGTTGVAKGVTITGEAYGANIIGAKERFGVNENDVFLSILPLYHSYEGTCGFLLPVCVGASVYYARSLKPNELLEDLQTVEPTLMLVVPLFIEKFRNGIFRRVKEKNWLQRILFRLFYHLSQLTTKGPNQGLGKVLFQSLRQRIGFKKIRYVVSGGSALPLSVEQDMQALGIPLVQGYGLTECAPLVSANSIKQYKRGSVGKPFEFCEVRVVADEETKDGILQVRGINVTKGYWNNPKATEAVFTEDGWLITGDVVQMDEDGFLYIVGRRKDVIVTSAGKNVYPETLEREILKDERIAECVVFGTKNRQGTGEMIATIVVFNEEWITEQKNKGNEISDEELHRIAVSIIAAVNERQPEYRRITNIKVSKTELEKTVTRKVKRYKYQQEKE
ncbi:MAG: AMP-binding protein [bacterium]|nr:AMP-binding protein [bacterium]